MHITTFGVNSLSDADACGDNKKTCAIIKIYTRLLHTTHYTLLQLSKSHAPAMSTTAKLAGLLRDEQGPVAFNDAVDEDAVPVEPLTEHDDAISAMSAAHCNNMQFRCYRGFWISEMWAPGVVAVHRSFAPRADDVLVASLQKSGTTWLKALTFATMARGAWPPSSHDHPLRRLNPHLCVPSLEVLYTLGRDALLDMLPSPRLLSTHMPLSLLPPSTCKIVYIYRSIKHIYSILHRRPDQSSSFSMATMFNF
jgi:hypothetical protein